MTLTKSKYYFEALDNYPYSLPDCLEALNYALSYDPEDADSLCLMGRIYSEMLNDYEKAKLYFEEAMQCDVTNLNTPRYYIRCLLDNEDLQEAEKLINYSLKIKGIDKSTLWFYRALLSEMRGSFPNALKFLAVAKQCSYNKEMLEFHKEREQFVKSKMPKKLKKKSAKTKKETN
jgi:tetratricopeptide (TPR) repeat protein